jgi:LPXTG-motif cell wall-anchored protein
MASTPSDPNDVLINIKYQCEADPLLWPFVVLLALVAAMVAGASLFVWRRRRNNRAAKSKPTIGVWRGVSKGVDDGRRLPALRAGHPWGDPPGVTRGDQG